MVTTNYTNSSRSRLSYLSVIGGLVWLALAGCSYVKGGLNYGDRLNDSIWETVAR